MKKKKNLRVKWPRVVQGSFVLHFLTSTHFALLANILLAHLLKTPQSIVIYTEILILLSIKNKKISYLNLHDFRGDGLELV